MPDIAHLQAIADELETAPSKGLLETVLRDLLDAEADYRSAMKIYANHPSHKTRIRAEVNWGHAKNVAKAVLESINRESAA